jgi:hypothetical protein
MAIVVNTGHVTLEGVVANEGDKGRSERPRNTPSPGIFCGG